METRDNVFGLRRIVYFEPSELGVYTKPVTGGFAPVSPATILNDAGAAAALNGPMFVVCDGQDLPPGNAEYAASTCDVLSYRHLDGALNVRGVYPTRGMTFSVLADGTTRVMHGDQVAEGAKVAVQGYPPLVDTGRNVATLNGSNASRLQRSGFAIMRDGRMALAVGTGTMPAFADALIEAGAVNAAYSDGGGSTALVTAEGRAGSSEARPVPSWLVVRKPSSAGWWIAGGLALAAAWFLWG